MQQLNFTIINHTARIELDLTANEYIVADLIYNLSNNPDSNGWCYASREWIGGALGLSKRSIITILDKLLQSGLIEKHSMTKHLRTTSDWYNKVIIKNGEESSPSVKKVHRGGEESSPDIGEESSPDSIYNDNIYNDNYNESASLKIYSSINYLKNIPQDDITEFTSKWKLSENELRRKADDLIDYCNMHGKRFKNYRAFLRKAINKDFSLRNEFSIAKLVMEAQK